MHFQPLLGLIVTGLPHVGGLLASFDLISFADSIVAGGAVGGIVGILKYKRVKRKEPKQAE